MREPRSSSSEHITSAVEVTKPANAAVFMALLIIVLVTLHLGGDMVYGYEPARVTGLVGVPIAGLWFYATLSLAGRRLGYVLLLIGSFLAAIVPVVHMSGRGVREEVVQSTGGFFFVWILIALAMSATVSLLLSIHGLWRLKQTLLGFVLWCVAPVAALVALLGYVVYTRN